MRKSKTKSRNRSTLQHKQVPISTELEPRKFQISEQNKSQSTNKAYDASKYLKNDLKWTAVTAGIVIIVLIVAYLTIR
jgi:hypothetical protein